MQPGSLVFVQSNPTLNEKGEVTPGLIHVYMVSSPPPQGGSTAPQNMLQTQDQYAQQVLPPNTVMSMPPGVTAIPPNLPISMQGMAGMLPSTSASGLNSNQLSLVSESQNIQTVASSSQIISNSNETFPANAQMKSILKSPVTTVSSALAETRNILHKSPTHNILPSQSQETNSPSKQSEAPGVGMAAQALIDLRTVSENNTNFSRTQEEPLDMRKASHMTLPGQVILGEDNLAQVTQVVDADEGLVQIVEVLHEDDITGKENGEEQEVGEESGEPEGKSGEQGQDGGELSEDKVLIDIDPEQESEET